MVAARTEYPPGPARKPTIFHAFVRESSRRSTPGVNGATSQSFGPSDRADAVASQQWVDLALRLTPKNWREKRPRTGRETIHIDARGRYNSSRRKSLHAKRLAAFSEEKLEGGSSSIRETDRAERSRLPSTAGRHDGCFWVRRLVWLVCFNFCGVLRCQVRFLKSKGFVLRARAEREGNRLTNCGNMS